MHKILDKTEKILLRTVVMGMVLLVVVQGIMVNEPARLFLSWAERMEGQTLKFPAAVNQEDTEQESPAINSPQAAMTISIQQFSSLPQTKVLINGEERAFFEKKEMEIPLMAGDTIEIDCTSYNFPVEFSIDTTSENLAWPEKGKTFTANQSIVMIGKVIVK